MYDDCTQCKHFDGKGFNGLDFYKEIPDRMSAFDIVQINVLNV